MKSRIRLVGAGVLVLLLTGLGASVSAQGPFAAQIENFWRLVMDRLVADFPTFFVGGAVVQ